MFRSTRLKGFDQILHLFIFITSVFQFEADRRAFIITINSFGTELGKDERAKLYPRCGKLYPDGLALLTRADDYDQVRNVAECYAVSRQISKDVNAEPGYAWYLHTL